MADHSASGPSLRRRRETGDCQRYWLQVQSTICALTQSKVQRLKPVLNFLPSAGSGIPSPELAASRMTAFVVVALEAASISSFLVFCAPMMPDRLPETLALTILVPTSFFLHYR
jgi:hypothetical protein